MQRLAGDVAGAGPAEESNGGGDFVRLAAASDRRQALAVRGAPVCALMPPMFTIAPPPAANAREIARPILRAPPVTRTTLPASSLASAMVLSYKNWRSTEGSMLASAERADRVRVFWQPGCTSCLRTKEFLARNGVDFESINVHGNAAGMEELRKLGARSVPIVARGDRFVFAQTIGDVIRFLGLDVRQHERLSPEALMQKLDLVLTAAARFVRQIPAGELDKPFRNRNRPIRVLAHHVFRIVEGFLESMQDGGELTYERIMTDAPLSIQTGEDIARHGEAVLARAKQWWAAYADRSCQSPMQTYFGTHPVHVVLERAVWHPAQHARQLMLILETFGIAPDGPLGAADLAGLPLPEKAWDED